MHRFSYVWERLGKISKNLFSKYLFAPRKPLSLYSLGGNTLKSRKSLCCEECGGTLALSSHELVCSKCGLVHQRELLDESQEWIAAPISTQLGTTPLSRGAAWFRDSSGKVLHPAQQRAVSKLVAVQRALGFNRDSEQRALTALKRAVEFFGLPRTLLDEAVYLYKKASRTRRERITSTTLAALCFYLATRSIADRRRITPSDVVSCFRKLGYRVTLHRFMLAEAAYRGVLRRYFRVWRSEDYVKSVVDRVVSHPLVVQKLEKNRLSIVRFRISLVNETELILSKIDKYERGGRNPYAITACAVYAAAKVLQRRGYGVAIPAKWISDCTGVAEYTLREHYIELFKRIVLDTA